MNTKWFSGIGLTILLSTGALVYTTTTQARPKAAPAAAEAPDATLENLKTCATEKNPAYVEGVLKGAMNAFDKDAKAAIKAGKPANFKKAANNLLKVIKFLFVQSKHFSPIYKHEAHKATFDKDIDKLIQTLFHAEYALAKSKSAQKEVLKSYTALVAELTKDGVGHLTKIAAPSKKAAKGVLAKMQSGIGKAAAGAKKVAKPAKEEAPVEDDSLEAVGRQEAQVFEPEEGEEEAPAEETPAEDAPAEEEPAEEEPAADDAPAEDVPAEEEPAEEEPAADDAAPEGSDDAVSDDESVGDGSDADDSDDNADLQTEEAGTFDPEEEALAEDEEEEDPVEKVKKDATKVFEGAATNAIEGLLK